MADATPLARLWAALALAALGAEVPASAAVADESSGRVAVARPVEYGELPPVFSPAGAFEAPQLRDIRFDFPQQGAQREARLGLSAKVGGGATPSAMHDRPLCERLAAWAETIVPATEDPGLPPPSINESIVSGTLVDLPDAALRKAVEEALGKSPGDPIVRGEMATLRVLNSETGVQRLTGIEHAVNLRRLCLVRGQISDLGPLAGVTSLRRLHLSSNAIANVSPLRHLAQLTVLGLGGNDISDARPLADLGSLKMLDLDWNEISDVAPLAGLTSLTWLDLYRNDTSDLAPLSGLTSLKTLGLSGNGISDVAPLAALTSLTWLDLSSNDVNFGTLAGLESLMHLDLSYNGIVELGSSAGLDSLTSLSLRVNEISNVAPLARLRSLKALDLSRNRISDVAALVGLKSLATVDLWANAVSDVAPLAGLPLLTSLNLTDNKVAHLGPLAETTSLRTLRLGRNRISEVAALSGLTSLRELELQENELTSIEQLSGLTSLTLLYLYDNKISDAAPLAGLTSLAFLLLDRNAAPGVAPLAGLKSLRKLGMSGNAVADVAPLAGLTSLEYLYLSDNAIADMGPLAGLRSLKWLFLNNNRLTTLVPKLFEKFPRLTLLGLAGNQLSALPTGFFGGVGGLDGLWLDENPGAPFVIEAVPALATTPRQRPARVAVRIAEGAPIELEVAVHAVGGRLEAEAARMAAGVLLSDALTVWPAGRGPVFVHATPPELPTTWYSGITLSAGSPLVLNGLAEYSDLDEPANVDLTSAFREFDGSPTLMYAVRTDDPAVAAVDRTGSMLRIEPIGPGIATITVTVTTSDGRTATLVFDVTVPGPSPLRGWRWKLLEAQ